MLTTSRHRFERVAAFALVGALTITVLPNVGHAQASKKATAAGSLEGSWAAAAQFLSRLAPRSGQAVGPGTVERARTATQ